MVCASLQDLNEWLNIDEGLYVFKLHGVGGMIGSFLTGIFADQAISFLDGSSLAPGGWNGNGAQVGRQFAEIGAISSYSKSTDGSKPQELSMRPPLTPPFRLRCKLHSTAHPEVHPRHAPPRKR